MNTNKFMTQHLELILNHQYFMRINYNYITICSLMHYTCTLEINKKKQYKIK